MANLNKVFLIGRLTRDPELRYTTNGKAMTELSIAVNRSFTAADGDRREETTFIDITVWNRQAETCCQYLKKGRSVHVEGHLKLDSWEDKASGEKRSKLRVGAENVQFLDSRGNDGGGETDFRSSPPRETPRPAAGNGPSRASYPPPHAEPAPMRRPEPAPDLGEDDDDIPF